MEVRSEVFRRYFIGNYVGITSMEIGRMLDRFENIFIFLDVYLEDVCILRVIAIVKLVFSILLHFLYYCFFLTLWSIFPNSGKLWHFMICKQ